MSQSNFFNSPFSEKERERRWQKTREFMQERGLDGMLVFGNDTWRPVDRYFSNTIPGCTVIFPLKGEPILMVSGLGAMLTMRPDIPGERPWIKDVRTGARGAMIVAALKDRGLERGHVGVIGVGAFGNRWEGYVPFGIWERVIKRLPDCKFEDMGLDYAEHVMGVKSEEELVHVRHSAEILEEVCVEMLRVVRPGVSELEVCSAIQKVQLDHGSPPRVSFGSAPGSIGTIGTATHWAEGIGVPRILQPGDVIVTEIWGVSRGYQAQVQMCVALPPVSDTDAECARIARLSYEAGVRAIRPGTTFEEVSATMEAPLDRPQVWHQTPLIHDMNPSILIGPTGVNIQRMPGIEAFPQVGTGHIRGGETVLKPGMVFELEPNVCIGKNRINIGGTVLVTENGAEELNKLPTEMRLARKSG